MESFMSGGAAIPPPSTFLSKLFSTSSESLSEIYNPIQFAIISFLPLYILNKSIATLFPEPNFDSSSLIILAEIIFQIAVMIVGIVLIYRIVDYFPTYSGYKYEPLTLNGPITILIIILLSIQSKLGIKTNILAERFNELWNGSNDSAKEMVRKNVRINSPTQHVHSQADYLDNSTMNMMTSPPPTPIATSRPNSSMETMMRTSSPSPSPDAMNSYMGPAAANTMLGSSFGSKF
jgi:hypothetical protein